MRIQIQDQHKSANCLIRVLNFIFNSFSLILKNNGVCCYCILGGNVIFISYFNAKLVFFFLIFRTFEKDFFTDDFWVIKNLSHFFSFCWYLSFCGGGLLILLWKKKGGLL